MNVVRRSEAGYSAVRAVPGGRLSGGMAIDAEITARLFGLRLLKLDAHLTFLPVTPVADEPAPPASGHGGLHEAAELVAHATRTLGQVGPTH